MFLGMLVPYLHLYFHLCQSGSLDCLLGSNGLGELYF